jgi:hypothetical protein
MTFFSAGPVGMQPNSFVTLAWELPLNITDVASNVITFDVFANSDGIEVDLTNVTGTITSVATGAGDDTIIASVDQGAGLAANATINGGSGNNRLQLESSAARTVQYNMSNVQTISLAALGGALTFSAANASSIEAIEASADLNNSASFVNMGATEITVDVLGENIGNGAAISSNHSGASTLNLTASEAADEDAKDMNDTDMTLSQTSSVELNLSEFMDYEGDVTANNATSFTANIEGTVDSTFGLNAATSATIVTGDYDGSTIVLNGNSLTKLAITAGADLGITGSALESVKALTVATEGDFTAGDFSSLNIANLSGSGSVELGDLGVTDQDFNLTVNASGLSGGLTLGDGVGENGINVGAGHNITINAGVEGKITLSHGATVADGGSISVTIGSDAGEAQLNTLSAASVTVGGLNSLSAVNATIDADTAQVAGSELSANEFTVTVSDSAEVSGGIEGDTFKLNGGAEEGSVAEFTLTGGLGSNIFNFSTPANTGAIRATITDFDGDTSNAGLKGDAIQDEATIVEFLNNLDGISDVTAEDVTVMGDVDSGVFEFDGSTHLVGSGDAEFGDGDVFITLAGVTGLAAATANSFFEGA